VSFAIPTKAKTLVLFDKITLQHTGEQWRYRRRMWVEKKSCRADS